MKENFTELSEMELAIMIESAQKVLKDKMELKRKDVMSQIKELAASISANVEITEALKPSGRKGSNVPVKYQNSNNLSQKWSGRGMRPKWLQGLIDQGHHLEEFKLGHS
jgi:DNA-binding protein H-NS